MRRRSCEGCGAAFSDPAALASHHDWHEALRERIERIEMQVFRNECERLVEHVTVLDPKPGDTIAISVKHGPREGSLAGWHRAFRDKFPGIQVLVTDGVESFTVIRARQEA